MATPNNTTKRCTKCKREFPATSEFFGRNGTKLRPDCRTCHNAHNRGYYQENKEATKIRVKHYREQHPEWLKWYQQRWREENRAKFREYQKAFKSRHRERHKQDRLNHLEEYRARERRYRESNREKNRERGRIYYQSNKPQALYRWHQRRARKKAASGNFTASQVLALYKQQKGLCWWCSTALGDKYHADHRIPLSRGGSNDISNIVLSCPSCNLSKHNKLPHEWIGRLL